MTSRPPVGIGMAPEDIGSLRQVEDPQVSPDGRFVTCTVVDVDLEANCYRRHVWLAPTDASEAARPFSAGRNDQLARWSPDGRRLAVISSPEDGAGGVHQICLLPVGSAGERVVIAEWPAPPSELAWSPDGASIAFVARVPEEARYGRPGQPLEAKDMPPRHVTRLSSRLDSHGFVLDRPSHVMVVPADGSAPPRDLTPGVFDATGSSWSPDGSRIAFASARHDSSDLDGAVDLWTVELGGSSTLERLTATDSTYSLPSWSPDGARIAYLRNPTPLDEPRHERVGVLELAGRSTVDLAVDLDRNCKPYGAARPPVWCGETLLVGVEDAGNVHLYRVDAGGAGAPELVVGGDRWLSGYHWVAGALALALSTPTGFPELVVRALEPGSPSEAAEKQLTHLTASLADRRVLVEPLAFEARSADGTGVPCWAMPPVGAREGRRYPVLLNIHGGPFTSYGNRFFDEFQLEVGAGFGVLYCNPRGSSGYSEAWGRAIRWPEAAVDPGSGWGGIDYEDVLACVDEACRLFAWVDPDRLGIMGGSYGGYMTSWAIGHTDRFRAACSERAANNLLALEGSSDLAGSFRGVVGLSHLEHREAFIRQSPITYVSSMTTPVLIVHSEDDLRCPISQAEELFVALRLLGRTPLFIRFPGESHELTRSGAPRHRVERARIILDWFHERLAPEVTA